MVKNTVSSNFKTILKINGLILVAFVGILFAIFALAQDKFGNQGLTIIATSALGFFAFTFYYYYLFTTGRRHGNKSAFPERVFILNLLMPVFILLLILWLLTVL